MGLTWHWIWMHPRSAFCGQLSYLHALNAVPNTVLNCGSADELWVLAASCGNLGSNRASWCEIRWPERGPTQLGLPSQVPKSFSPSHSEELVHCPFPLLEIIPRPQTDRKDLACAEGALSGRSSKVGKGGGGLPVPTFCC